MAKDLRISVLLDFYGDMLTEKQREVMVQYYNDDLSLAEIAENFGITRQGVRDAIKRSGNVLLELEEKVGFAECSDDMQQKLAELQQLAQNIEFANSEAYRPSAKVANSVGRMKEIFKELAE
jgi:predicted DNA-binding protein YlxM (UPF0122 family)